MVKMKYFKLGIDVGSTTIKVVVLNYYNKVIYSDYKRHFSDIKTTLKESLKQCIEELGNVNLKVTVTGSGGIAAAEWLKELYHVQEPLKSFYIKLMW